MTGIASPRIFHPMAGLGLAWSGFTIMWAVWICFAIFLAEPRAILPYWPLPTVDGQAHLPAWAAGLVDAALIAVFGLQHSVMARPWFKQQVLGRLPPAYERCVYVHMANAALLLLIVFWQPIPTEVWNAGDGALKDMMWVLFAAGWIILFMGGWSFGIRDLLGIEQMQAWIESRQAGPPKLKTGYLYRWLSHPMYVGVLLAVWATPRMSAGHMLLAGGLTAYVLIAMRYEERDLRHTFGSRYAQWRAHGADIGLRS